MAGPRYRSGSSVNRTGRRSEPAPLLQGIARRLYEKRFTPEMLAAYHQSDDLRKEEKQQNDQPTLF
jgi:hypothetical protein